MGGLEGWRSFLGHPTTGRASGSSPLPFAAAEGPPPLLPRGRGSPASQAGNSLRIHLALCPRHPSQGIQADTGSQTPRLPARWSHRSSLVSDLSRPPMFSREARVPFFAEAAVFFCCCGTAEAWPPGGAICLGLAMAGLLLVRALVYSVPGAGGLKPEQRGVKGERSQQVFVSCSQ